MAQTTVTLPADLQRYADNRVEMEGFSDRSAYLRALVERDQDRYRADVARVQALIDEGMASGIVDRDALEILDEIIAGINQPHG